MATAEAIEAAKSKHKEQVLVETKQAIEGYIETAVKKGEDYLRREAVKLYGHSSVAYSDHRKSWELVRDQINADYASSGWRFRVKRADFYLDDVFEGVFGKAFPGERAESASSYSKPFVYGGIVLIIAVVIWGLCR